MGDRFSAESGFVKSGLLRMGVSNSDLLCWHSAINGKSRDVLPHDSSGGNHSTIPDFYTRKNSSPCPEPDIFTNDHPRTFALSGLNPDWAIPLHLVIGRENADHLGNHRPFAYANNSTCRSDVVPLSNINIIADKQPTVITSVCRIRHDTDIAESVDCDPFSKMIVIVLENQYGLPMHENTLPTQAGTCESVCPCVSEVSKSQLDCLFHKHPCLVSNIPPTTQQSSYDLRMSFLEKPFSFTFPP